MVDKNDKKILIIGKAFNKNSIEQFYSNSFKLQGYSVYYFDFDQSFKKVSLKDKVKLIIKSIINNNFEFKIQKLNNELALQIIDIDPNIVMTFTNAPLLCNTIMLAKSIKKDIKFVYYWADTVMNLQKSVAYAAPFYDLLAIHSKSLIEQFTQLGFTKSIWVPFGVDQIHITSDVLKKYHIGFLGGYSKERENILKKIIDHYPQLDIAISGQGWERATINKVKKYVVGGDLYGKYYSEFFSSCLISLNIISPLSYPSTNMRFFELMVSDSIQLTTFSPEQSNEYINGVDLFYYVNNNDLIEKIKLILSLTSKEISIIANNAKKKALNNAKYQYRVEKILSNLNL